MKGRLLAAIVFAALMYFGMGQLNTLQPPPPAAHLLSPVQAECALPVQEHKLCAPVSPVLPQCSEYALYPQALAFRDAPLLLASYHRTVYQAFHYSDCAG